MSSIKAAEAKVRQLEDDRHFYRTVQSGLLASMIWLSAVTLPHNLASYLSFFTLMLLVMGKEFVCEYLLIGIAFELRMKRKELEMAVVRAARPPEYEPQIEGVPRL